jgi:5'-3' exonuclease
MKNRTLLIDANFLIKRSFHANKDSYNNNIHIGAIYSFYTTLRKLIVENQSTKVILMFDGEMGGKLRHLIDPLYKANRKHKEWSNKIELSDYQIKLELEKEQSILFQRKRIQAYAEELFIRQVEIDEIEADDLIAEYCLTHHNDEDISLFTRDRDFLQLLDLDITILFSDITTPITKRNFFKHFNYHYSNALLMKVICGDKADNITPIKGIGEDTLIKYFPDLKFKNLTVREICIESDRINKDRILKKLKPIKCLDNILNNVERLYINHKLVNLREPMLNEEAYEALSQLEMPLSPENRGSKNLYNLMIEDGFFNIYKSDFVSYVQPFYTVIANEKQLLLEYEKKLKKRV